MGLSGDEFVEIQLGKNVGEPSVVTVNCPDKTGLCCDLCRIILEFGLCISRGDVSTDGQWCFVVLWVVPSSLTTSIQWESLKSRLLSECPSFSFPFYLDLGNLPKVAQTYLLKLFSINRKGLLHDVTHVLCELDLCVHRVKVSTTPDGKVMDLFFITDGMEQLHTRKRQDETRQKLSSVLGDSCMTCEIELAEGFQQGFSSLPPNIAGDLFNSEQSNISPPLGSELAAKAKMVNVAVDNSLSPCHTLLQIHSLDQKGLFYDILRTLKDHNIRISYGRFLSDMSGGFRDIDLFIQHTDGKKLVDPEKQNSLCSILRLEMLCPLKIFVVNRGPDHELLVANSVELSGKGRPRVFYDVTLALKKLGICIFSAEIGKHNSGEKQWEVYRFLLEERGDFPLSTLKARDHIIDGVQRTLMGW